MKLPLRHLQINPQGNEFAYDHPDYPKDAGCSYEHDYDAILNADGEIVADNAGYYPTGIDRDAAAHIVKCVNMHDRLVEALKRLSSATPVIIGGDRDQLDEAEEYAEIVLAEALGEAPHA